MFLSLRARFLNTLEEAFELLEEMAPVDPRAYRALTTPDIPYQSTASAPSLRAREVNMGPAPTMPSSDAGNVKVVVRVRKFIQRGSN